MLQKFHILVLQSRKTPKGYDIKGINDIIGDKERQVQEALGKLRANFRQFVQFQGVHHKY